MKILFFLIFCFELFAQSACIYQGADVLCLKSNLKFQTSLNRIITGNPADPKVTATAGIPGDLYIRLTTGQHYIKADSGTTTNWNLIATGTAGLGDVVGPGVATDNAFAVYNGTTGKLIKNGTVTTSTITTMQGDITTLQTSGATGAADILALQTDMTTAETNITNLQTDMTTAQGDITALQTDSHTHANKVLLDTLTAAGAGTSFLADDGTYKVPAGGGVAIPTCLAGEFNTSNGTAFSCATPAGGGGTGDVVGPGVSADNGIALYDGTTGKLIKDSGTLSYATTEALNIGLDGGELWINGDWTTGGRPHLNFTDAGAGGSTFRIIQGANAAPVNLILPTTQPANNQILQAQATGQLAWINTPGGGGSGDVVGPGTSIDNNLATFNGATGKLIKDGGISSNSVAYVSAFPAGAGSIPTLTSNTTPAPYIVTCTPVDVNCFHAFIASVAAFPSDSIFDIKLPAPTTITSYGFKNYTGTYKPVNWTVEGSTDGIAWTVLDTKTGQSNADNANVVYNFSSDETYQYFRFHVTATTGANSAFTLLQYYTKGSAPLNSIPLMTSTNGAFVPSVYTFPSTMPTVNQILQSDAAGKLSWVTTGGGNGDVIGPLSSIDYQIPIFSGITGKLLQSPYTNNLIVNNNQGAGTGLNVAGDFLVTHSGGNRLFSVQGTNINIGSAIGTSGGIPTLRIYDNSLNSIGFTVPNPITTSYILTYPGSPPTINQILQSDAAGQLSWINTPSAGGTGDVVGPAVSVDNRLAVFSLTTGKIIKDSSGIVAGGGGLLDLGATGSSLFLSDGYFTGRTLKIAAPIGTNSVIINTPSPLTDYSITLPNAGPPAANQILQSDAVGQLSWINTPIAGAAPPTCTGSQRLTANGTVLSCVDNTYQVPAALNIDWATAHVFYKSVAANTTFTFSNQVNGQVIILAVENTSGADITATLPASNWAGGTIGGVVKATSKTLFTFTRINGQNYVTFVENMK